MASHIVSKAIHSVGAGSSLLSAPGIGQRCGIRSSTNRKHTLMQHYMYQNTLCCRSDMGKLTLLPTSFWSDHNGETSSNQCTLAFSRPNVRSFVPRYFVSVLDNFACRETQAKAHNEWSPWRETRRITNEPALLARIKTGLERLCTHNELGKCTYHDTAEEPERWASPEVDEQTRELRFGTIGKIYISA